MKYWDKESACNFLLLAGIVILLSYAVANRDVTVGSDTETYITIYNDAAAGITSADFEPIFVVIMAVSAFFSEKYEVFLFLASCVLFALALTALLQTIHTDLPMEHNWPNINLYILALLLISPFFFALQVNVLRQGLATPLLALGYLAVTTRKYYLAILYFAAAVGLHSTSIIFLLVAPFLLLSNRVLISVIAVLSFSYLLGYSKTLMSMAFEIVGLSSQFSEFLEYGSDTEYKAGVRPDFWVFTAVFIFISWVCAKLEMSNGLMLKFTLVAFIPFLLFGYIAYSDRFLILSWYYLPALAAIPVWQILQKLPSLVIAMLAYYCVAGAGWLFLYKLNFIV